MYLWTVCICFISTSTSSHLNLSISGNIRLSSPPSQLPHTARRGRKAASLSASCVEHMSPACHISSHVSKYSRYLSSQYEWVSLIIPILFIANVLLGKKSWHGYKSCHAKIMILFKCSKHVFCFYPLRHGYTPREDSDVMFSASDCLYVCKGTRAAV